MWSVSENRIEGAQRQRDTVAMVFLQVLNLRRFQLRASKKKDIEMSFFGIVGDQPCTLKVVCWRSATYLAGFLACVTPHLVAKACKSFRRLSKSMPDGVTV